ncbi:M56 family metallopeptidase [Lysobacter sp. HA35]
MQSLAALQFGIAPALASALLHALWQDALLGVIAWAVLAAMSRSSASLRHAAAMGFLLAMVIAPVSSFPQLWHVPATVTDSGSLTAVAAPQVIQAGRVIEHQSSPLAIVLTLLWLTGVAAMLLRHLGGWRLVASLEKQPFERLPADWQRRVDSLCAAMRIGRDVSVRLSKDVVGPFTARLFRPVIWLPLSLITQLPREQVEALLAHELAHVARMDWLWNGLQCVVESLLFFHPAAWWLGRRIRIEREHACDDLAVTACGDAIALAEALAQLERQRQPAPRLVLAAHGGSLMQRITRLISGPPSRGRWGTRAGIAVVLITGTVLVAQLGIAGNTRPGVRIRSTTDGPLRPGDMREVSAHGIDGDRYYRVDVDANGYVTEVFKRDGTPQPVDAGVRRWADDMVAVGVPPPPPPPPLPPMAAMPPLPPPPPPPPEISDSAEFQSLVRLVAADPGVIARLGTPVAMASKAVQGRIDIDANEATTSSSNGRTFVHADPKADGDADVRFDLTGPKGRATVHVDAELKRGTWSTKTIELQGPAR